MNIASRIYDIKRLTSRFYKGLKVPINLSIHAADHCNLNCLGCTPFSPIADKKFCDLELLDKALGKLKRFEKHLGEIKVVGGEPLLNPDLSSMLKIIRRHLPSKKIFLWTNGIYFLQPDKLPQGLWECCRENDVEIRLTRYPISLDYDAVEEVCRAHGVKCTLYADKTKNGKGWTLSHLHEDGGGVLAYKIKILKMMRCPSFNCMQLVGDKIFPCTQSAYSDKLNKKFKTNFIVSRKDYIDVNDIKSVWDLRKLMLIAVPFCRYCGKGYFPVEWGISRQEKREWIAEKK